MQDQNPLVLPPKKEWGPQFWNVMTTVAIGMGKSPSPELQQEIKQFYYSLMHALPCPECREHYAGLWKRFPIDAFLVSDKALVEWVKFIQKQVNQVLLKKAASEEVQTPPQGQPQPQPPQPVQKQIQKQVQKVQVQSAQPRRLTAQERHIAQNSSGTPAAYATATSKAHLTALQRLQQSAKYYVRPCSC